MPAEMSFSRIFASPKRSDRRAAQSPTRPAIESMGRRAADSVSEPPVDSATYPYVWIWSIVAEEPRGLLEVDDEDHHARPEEKNGCDCDQPDTHVTRPVFAICLIQNDPMRTMIPPTTRAILPTSESSIGWR